LQAEFDIGYLRKNFPDQLTARAWIAQEVPELAV